MSSESKLDSDDAESVRALKQKIESLQQRLKQSAEKSKQLSWDTDQLVRKTQSLKGSHIISCTDATWKETVEALEIGGEGVLIKDVWSVDQIEFIAAFSAKRQLAMIYGNHSFHLQRRPTESVSARLG